MVVVDHLVAETGPLRFSELRRRTGISQKVLTAGLCGLERDGYLTRSETPAVPKQVTYALTDMGRGVLGPVRDLARWAAGQNERIKDARRRYDERAPP